MTKLETYEMIKLEKNGNHDHINSLKANTGLYQQQATQLPKTKFMLVHGLKIMER